MIFGPKMERKKEAIQKLFVSALKQTVFCIKKFCDTIISNGYKIALLTGYPPREISTFGPFLLIKGRGENSIYAP